LDTNENHNPNIKIYKNRIDKKNEQPSESQGEEEDSVDTEDHIIQRPWEPELMPSS